jgi:hypothetical protein
VDRSKLRATTPAGSSKPPADRGVEPFCTMSTRRLSKVPVRQHCRIARQEVGEQRNQELRPKAWPMLTFNVPAGSGRAAAPASAPATTSAALNLLQEALAALGQRQPARAAVEQAHADVGFEPRHVSC